MTQRIVVGVDGSPQSKQALARAAEEAAAHGASLEVVHAWNFLDQPGPEFDPAYGEASARASVEAIIAEVLGATPRSPRRSGWSTTIRHLRCWNASQGAYTLVVGARGLGGFKEPRARIGQPAPRPSRPLPRPRRPLTHAFWLPRIPPSGRSSEAKIDCGQEQAGSESLEDSAGPPRARMTTQRLDAPRPSIVTGNPLTTTGSPAAPTGSIS